MSRTTLALVLDLFPLRLISRYSSKARQWADFPQRQDSHKRERGIIFGFFPFFLFFIWSSHSEAQDTTRTFFDHHLLDLLCIRPLPSHPAAHALQATYSSPGRCSVTYIPSDESRPTRAPCKDISRAKTVGPLVGSGSHHPMHEKTEYGGTPVDSHSICEPTATTHIAQKGKPTSIEVGPHLFWRHRCEVVQVDASSQESWASVGRDQPIVQFWCNG